MRRDVDLPQGTIRYEDTGPRDAPVVVFVHGLLVDGTLWRKVTPQLDAGLRCIVPDLPLGAHRVALNAIADRSPRGVATLLADLLEALDLDDVTLVANDTGGAIAQLLVTERPQRVARLVLTPCDCFDQFLPTAFRPLQWAARVPGLLPAVLQVFRVRSLRRLPLTLGWLAKHPIDHDVVDAWGEGFFSDAGVRRDTVAFVRAIDARDTLDAAARLPRFGKPALVVWGEDDHFFPQAYARRLATLLDARLEIVQDAYAFVPEDQPHRLARLVQDFVAEGRASAPTSPGSSAPRAMAPAVPG